MKGKVVLVFPFDDLSATKVRLAYDRVTIKTYGSYNDEGIWYYTDACNRRRGMIHSS